MSTEPTPAIQQAPERPTCPGCKTVVSYVQWSCVSPHDGTIWHLMCAALSVESTRNAMLAAILGEEPENESEDER